MHHFYQNTQGSLYINHGCRTILQSLENLFLGVRYFFAVFQPGMCVTELCDCKFQQFESILKCASVNIFE